MGRDGTTRILFWKKLHCAQALDFVQTSIRVTEVHNKGIYPDRKAAIIMPAPGRGLPDAVSGVRHNSACTKRLDRGNQRTGPWCYRPRTHGMCGGRDGLRGDY